MGRERDTDDVAVIVWGLIGVAAAAVMIWLAWR
jgi:hypothetical protein